MTWKDFGQTNDRLLLAIATAAALAWPSAAVRADAKLSTKDASALAPWALQIVPPPNPTLPPLPGPYPVGTDSVELVDHARDDPFAPYATKRSVVAQLWYPASTDEPPPFAAYMSAEVGAVHDGTFGFAPGTFASIRTQARFRAGALRNAQGWPVVLFSPGRGISRSLYSVTLEGLASQGFVVVALDHPYDASVVQFPDGRMARATVGAPETPEAIAAEATAALEVRVADVRFVLDQLQQLGSLVDLQRVGMFGHSLGGATAAITMLRDERIVAGVNVDGTVFGAIDADLDRPFVLMSSVGHDKETDPTWATFWSHLHGFRRALSLAGSTHMTFTDFAPLVSVLEVADDLPEGAITAIIGTIDGMHASEVMLTYLSAFFDQTLRQGAPALLDHSDPRYPEMLFLD